jgi:hypothetical protein
MTAGINANSTNDVTLYFPAYNGQGTATSWLPNEYYIKVVFRLDCGTWYQHTCNQGFVAGQTNGEVASWANNGP